MATNYGIFFTKNSTVLRLPVNPAKLPIARGTTNGEYNVLGLGPIMIPRLPDLRVITISGLLPGRKFSGILTPNEFRAPEYYINFFRSAMTDKEVILYTPVRYYENGEPFATQDEGFECLVTSFSTEERGGETGDFYYDLEITEYKNYNPLRVQIATPATATQTTATATTEPARSIPAGQIVVGSVCIANGRYYASSYGDEPHGTANGKRVVVSRIVDLSRAYPYHINAESGGALGWITKANLQVVT